MVAKAMTKVWKPGANNKIAAVPYIPTQNFEQLVINALPIFCPYFRHPQQLENGPGSA